MRRLARMCWSAVLVFSVSALPALDILLDVEWENGFPVLECRASDVQRGQWVDFLGEGGTVRLIWLFRHSGTDARITRYARRDPLSEGYLIYDADWRPEAGPFDEDGLIGELTQLRSPTLDLIGHWHSDEDLEVRLFIDSGTVWPMFFPTQREFRSRSARRRLPHPGAVNE